MELLNLLFRETVLRKINNRSGCALYIHSIKANQYLIC